MRRPARALVLRTLATAAVVGTIVGMVASFGTRSALDGRSATRATSRAVAAVLTDQGDLAQVVRGGSLTAIAVVGPGGVVAESSGLLQALSDEVLASCTASGRENWQLLREHGQLAWCTGLPLMPGYSLVTLDDERGRRPSGIGLTAGLFAASLTGLVHLWLWVPRGRRELEALEGEVGDRTEALGRLAWTRQLAAIVAHEVRNPLQSLTALIDVMAFEPEIGQRRRLQDSLQQELETIEVVIRRLVDSGDSLDIQPRLIELEALLDSCVEVHRHRARGAGVTMRLLAPKTHRIALDPPLIRRALENVLVNALESLQRVGDGVVEVSVLPGPRNVTVHIDDNGPGVRPEDRIRLFEPGYSRRPGGTGLGLFLAAKVADAHGGTLEYGQSPLGGARFSLTLPRTETA